jgi:hypothetical protein
MSDKKIVTDSGIEIRKVYYPPSLSHQASPDEP